MTFRLTPIDRATYVKFYGSMIKPVMLGPTC